MERLTKTKEWVFTKKLDMELVVKMNLDKGATVTVTPTEGDTYNITASLPEPDGEFIPRLRDEVEKMSEAISDCGEKHKEYVEQIESIKKDIEVNTTLTTGYRERSIKARSVLHAMSNEAVKQ